MNYSFPLNYRVRNKKIIAHNLFSSKYRNIDCKIEHKDIDLLEFEIIKEAISNIDKKNKYLVPLGIFIEPKVLH